MLIPITLILLGASAPAGFPLEAAPRVALQEPAATVESFESLLEAYAQAKLDHKAQVRATKDRKERRKLRGLKPAKDFLVRFETLADAGDVRAMNWMLDELKDLGLSKGGRVEFALKVYGKIVSAPAGSEQFAASIKRLGEERRLEPAQRISLLKRVMGRKDIEGDGQCTAQLYAGSLLFKSEVESDIAMGKQILTELVANGSCGATAKLAEQALLNVSTKVGGMAPDFEGTTIDGEKFNLYDYRGKVVLVDFFGFW